MSDTAPSARRSSDTATAVSVQDRMVSVVIPAYNEEARLGATLKRMVAYLDAQSYSYEILVVDDGSSDGTVDVVRSVSERRSEVQLVTYERNQGKGYAVRCGMLRAKGDLILFSDADLATPIEELEKLLAAIDSGSDIAIGSRDVKGSQLVRRESAVRELGGRTFNKLVQALTVPGIRDTQCGFKLFTSQAARAIFQRCRVDHFAFDVEVLYLARRMFGYKVAEVPVRWAHQDGSKVSFLKDGMRMVRTVFQIRFSRYERAYQAIEARTP